MRNPMALLLLGFVAATSHAENTSSIQPSPAGLSKDVVPRNYLIHLEPDLDTRLTDGVESIEIEVLKSTDRIVLNALDMEVTKATIETDGRQEHLTPRLDSNAQTVSFDLENVLQPGRYTLSIQFQSRIFEQQDGLFIHQYEDGALNAVEHLLITGARTGHTRRIFPCWDEPVFRAAFQLSVKMGKQNTAISNSPVMVEQSLGPDQKIVVFEKTPSIASDNLFLVCGKLAWLDGEVAGVKLRIFTASGKSESATYAMEVTKQLLPYFSNYFATAFPLPKLDQIAFPAGSGDTTENLSQYVYDENDVLYDQAISDESARQRVFLALAGKIAAQWCSNLATLPGRKDFWLNEGLASWMANKAADHFNPQWKIWLHAGVRKNVAMTFDGGEMTQAIRLTVSGDEQTGEASEVITSKACFLLRMLENFSGEDAFRDGVRACLGADQGADRTSEDLWAALERVTGKPIKKIAVGWTEQPGFPLVKITTQCVKGNQVISLEQVPFAQALRSEAPAQWIVPVGIRSTANPNEIKYALLDKLSNNFDLAGCPAVVQANAGNVGYYRVLYEPALFNDLQNNIEKLPASDRLNLVSDTWALVESSGLPVSGYFDLLESMRHDDTLAVWQIALGSGGTIGALRLIDRLEQGRSGRESYQRYICNLFGLKFQELGWDARPGENTDTEGYRAILIETLGFFGDRDVIDESFKRFESFREHPSSLAPSLRSAVISIVGRYSSATVYHELVSMAENTRNAEEKRTYLRALGSALDPESAQETLEHLVSDKVTPDDMSLALENLATEGEHADIAWSFAVSHLKEMRDRIGPLRQSRLLSSIATGFADKQRADEILAFAQANLPPKALREVESSIRGIRFRAKLKAKILPAIDDWVKAKLEENQGNAARHP